MIVVKIGGSLYSHANFAPGLVRWLRVFEPGEVLLVPGGGGVADAVRELAAVHQLSEDTAHWIALESLRTTAAFVRSIVPGYEVLDCLQFGLDDDSQPGALPHCWRVTTDSIAARVATVRGATRLILLKSVDVSMPYDWQAEVEQGAVDEEFPHVVRGAAFIIDVVNFREYLSRF